jgi:hypothetical protein
MAQAALACEIGGSGRLIRLQRHTIFSRVLYQLSYLAWSA